MEVAIRSPNRDFDFNSARSTPYVLSAPSTPRRFGELYYFSAPTSPSRMAEDVDDFAVIENVKEDDDFAFHFSKDLERASLSAEELFHGGKIKPIEPPQSPVLSPKFSAQPRRRGLIFYFNKRKKEDEQVKEEIGKKSEQPRGRSVLSGSGRRSSRSLSPLRVSEHLWEDEEKHVQSATATSASSYSSKVTSSGSKKWRLKDFLLFRSASEGRATDKDPFRKYMKKKEEMKNSSSFRTVEGGSIVRRRSGPISAHELHYTVNKAVSDDMKKKTFLPYKQGILGRLAFNPAVHALANGFGSLYHR